MRLAVAFSLSLGLHSLYWFPFGGDISSPSKNLPEIEIHLERGVGEFASVSQDTESTDSETVSDSGDAFAEKKKNISETPPSQKSRSSSVVGSNPFEEVSRFQKSLRYPTIALEQGLESQCEFQITIGKMGKVEEILPTKNCNHPIFTKEFIRSASTWQFELPEGSSITIPVHFKIHDRIRIE